MTENEAIEILKTDSCIECIEDADSPIVCEYGACRVAETTRIAIKALEEIQQYRAIGTLEELQDMKNNYFEALRDCSQYRKVGTLEECRAAVENQTAKKPDYEGDGYSDGHLVYDTWICPCCEKHYEVDYDEYDFCPDCGQKLDWRASDETD